MHLFIHVSVDSCVEKKKKIPVGWKKTKPLYAYVFIWRVHILNGTLNLSKFQLFIWLFH